MFSAAIVVFTLGSIGCGMANSLAALVVARIVQGMGGAMMVPVGRLVLLRTVPKSELVRAMSYVSVPALIGPVMGPPLGGFIVTYASWRWIFFINIPIGDARASCSSTCSSEICKETRSPAIRSARLCADRDRAGEPRLRLRECRPRRLADRRTWRRCWLVGAACLVLYVRHARRVEHPIIDLALLQHPDLCRRRRSAAFCSAWGWAHCRFCCR